MRDRREAEDDASEAEEDGRRPDKALEVVRDFKDLERFDDLPPPNAVSAGRGVRKSKADL